MYFDHRLGVWHLQLDFWGGILVKQISKPRNFLSNLMSPVSPYSINSSYFVFVPSLQFMLFLASYSMHSIPSRNSWMFSLLWSITILDLNPAPSNSHHQDDILILRLGDPKLNLHLPLLLVDPIDNFHILNFSGAESAKRNPATDFFSARAVPRGSTLQSGVPAIPVLELTGFSTPSAARRLISPPSAA